MSQTNLSSIFINFVITGPCGPHISEASEHESYIINIDRERGQLAYSFNDLNCFISWGSLLPHLKNGTVQFNAFSFGIKIKRTNLRAIAIHHPHDIPLAQLTTLVSFKGPFGSSTGFLMIIFFVLPSCFRIVIFLMMYLRSTWSGRGTSSPPADDTTEPFIPSVVE